MVVFWFQVTLHGFRGWAVAGEVCPVELEASNCGQAPLENIRLGSSLNQALLLHEVSWGSCDLMVNYM